MEQGQLWRQYIIAGVANFAIASSGYSWEWGASVLPRELSGESPLQTQLYFHEISTMNYLMFMGIIAGPCFGGLISAELGRSWGLLASIIPLLVCWALVAVGTHIYLLYVARVCSSIAMGMLFTIVPLYCSEIATDNSRGALGSFLTLFYAIGMMFMYGVELYASYHVVALIGLAGVAVTGIMFFFIPETPTYKLLKGDKEGAAESLMMIRGRSRQGVEAELSLISADVTASLDKKATFGDVFKGSNCKAFYISCALVVAQLFSGFDIIIMHTQSILRHSQIYLPSLRGNIIVVTVQIIASFVTLIAVDRLGRRVLLIISTCGAAIGLALLGTYYTLGAHEIRIVYSLWYMPMMGFMLFIVSFNLGLGSLPLVLMSEILPIEVKMTASSIVYTLHGLLLPLVSMMHLWFMNLETNLFFFIFCICCVLAFLFAIFAVPETKGKSYREIQEALGGWKQTPAKA